jgi:hypothetical protein
VTAEEAEKLLRALGSEPAGARGGPPSDAGKPAARYLRIAVEKSAGACGPGKNVNIRVPLSLVKGGMRLGAMIPGYGDAISDELRRHGVDVDVSKLNPENLDAVLREMGELTVDVDQGKAQVRITCE